MSEDFDGQGDDQQVLFEMKGARSLLTRLLADARLYRDTKEYKELLDFVARLRHFSPFNAMVLHVQKPGLTYAATPRDWRRRFNRGPKRGARPLVILQPFGPIAFVFDVQDTEGKTLPEDVSCFSAHGQIDRQRLESFVTLLRRKGIELCWIDAGDASAGEMRVLKRAAKKTEVTQYQMLVNRNHDVAVQFATLAHELAHLYLGHLGPDPNLAVPKRAEQSPEHRELEAESVAYLVCARNGVTPKSESYLSHYVESSTTVNDLDLYQIMRAAGQVEGLLGLSRYYKHHTAATLPRGPVDLFGNPLTPKPAVEFFDVVERHATLTSPRAAFGAVCRSKPTLH